MLICLLSVYHESLSQTKADEYILKAAYLERFTRFIVWPDTTWESPVNFFEIAVIGDNPFGSTLESIYKKQKIKDRKVIIRYISSISEIGNCHILFICESKKGSLSEIIRYTQDKAILTVSQSFGFAAEGVIVNLYISGKNLRFEINEQSAFLSPLQVSYHLLKQARIVNPFGSTK